MLESLTPPKSLVDQVYEVILDALCDGMFKPGERLTQESIAARLNVSRQPVTHALAVLKAQGFLAQGRQGLTVTAVDPGFFAAIYQIRSAVEPLAVKLATPRLTRDSVARGRALIDHGAAQVAAGDSRASLQADMDFHSFIYELSGNPLIAETMRLHWRHLRRAMGEVLRHPGMSISVWKEHGRILDEMIRGDGDAAAELMRRHLVEAFERAGQADHSTPV
ncbi:GntR family transcriptional regulator [Afipia clevelandensis]|uniref:GntR family transcriptional regulator n=1 Tax=Afipia clevelandensis TaxID=1034 RepID=UPI0002E97DBA|nr:GntR family transcriptional regulator [Afipia clevelandensis]